MTDRSSCDKKGKLYKKTDIAVAEDKPADSDVEARTLRKEYKCATSTDPNDWGPRDGPFPTD